MVQLVSRSIAPRRISTKSARKIGLKTIFRAKPRHQQSLVARGLGFGFMVQLPGQERLRQHVQHVVVVGNGNTVAR